MKKRILSLLCSFVMLMTMLPATALADDTSFTFESLQSALLNSNGTGIYFTPRETFVWPENGGTLTFNQNLYLQGDWYIPENITLVFPRSGCGIKNSNANTIHTVTINGPVEVTAESHDQFISRCNVVMKPGSSIKLANDYASLRIGDGCTWTVGEGVTLTPYIRLGGTLTGEGTVSGQISVQGGFNGSGENAVLSGSLTVTGSVQVGRENSEYKDTMIIPVGSNIRYQPEGYSSISVASGSKLVLNGNLDISGSKTNRTTALGFADGACMQMGAGSVLSMHYPYELGDNRSFSDGGSVNPPSAPFVTGSGTIKYYADNPDSLDWYAIFGYDILGKYTTFDELKETLIPSYIDNGVTLWRSWDNGCEHEWTETSRTEPTCTAAGTIYYSCSKCEETKTEIISALNHLLSYSVSGSTIEQKCTREGCTHTASVTLSAENSTYTGSEIETASVDYTGEWAGAAPSLSYTDNINAGESTASMAAGGTSASVKFTIEKAENYTVTLGNLSQYSGSVSAVTWATNPPDKTAAATVEYQVATPEKPCTHVHDASCGANGENCQHEHDESCGYAAAGTAWTTEVPTAVGSYPVRVKLTGSDNLVLDEAYTNGTLTISNRPSGGGSSSGGSSSSGNKTETTTNPDGSTTTTVTRPNGSTTETTKNPDGSTEVVDTKKDGTVTTTTTDADGNKTAVAENTDGTTETTITNTNGTSSTTTTDADGKVEAEVKLPVSIVADAADKGETVMLPMPAVNAAKDRASAPTVTVDLSRGADTKVEIPVADVSAGTVAVLVNADGTEEIVKNCVPTEEGIALTVTDGATVKIIDNSKSFHDVAEEYWGADGIAFTASRELFNGTGENTFTPEGDMTRAMVVTVLARYEGVDTSTGDSWYDAGTQWAVENGVSDGSNLDQSITREQLVTMLYRYAGEPAASSSMDSFADAESVSDYAADALVWAVESGIITGMGDGSLNPQGTATRAQVATILMRFCENAAK